MSVAPPRAVLWPTYSLSAASEIRSFASDMCVARRMCVALRGSLRPARFSIVAIRAPTFSCCCASWAGRAGSGARTCPVQAILPAEPEAS